MINAIRDGEIIKIHQDEVLVGDIAVIREGM